MAGRELDLDVVGSKALEHMVGSRLEEHGGTFSSLVREIGDKQRTVFSGGGCEVAAEADWGYCTIRGNSKRSVGRRSFSGKMGLVIGWSCR